MTFGEHLEELRRRLLRGLIAFAVAFAAAFAFQGELMEFFARPYELARASINAERLAAAREAAVEPAPPLAIDLLVEELQKRGALDPEALARVRAARDAERRPAPPLLQPLQAIAALESFSAHMWICLLAALIVSAPVLLLELWRFVAEGLYEHEQQLVRRVLPFSLALFAAGLVFGYFVLVRLSIRFLVGYGDPAVIASQVAVGSYLALLFLLLLVMGLVFQIPLLMTILSATGLVSPDFYRGKRRHSILAIVIFAAVITPPDFVSQALVAAPMLVLFELGIVLARRAWARRGASKGQPV